jgi:hypothetical protein
MAFARSGYFYRNGAEQNYQNFPQLLFRPALIRWIVFFHLSTNPESTTFKAVMGGNQGFFSFC